MDVQAAVDAPRLHHQWFPDAVKVERGKSRGDLAKRLEVLGHEVEARAFQGDAHSILVDPKTGEYRGAADRRIAGKAAAP